MGTVETARTAGATVLDGDNDAGPLSGESRVCGGDEEGGRRARVVERKGEMAGELD